MSSIPVVEGNGEPAREGAGSPEHRVRSVGWLTLASAGVELVDVRLTSDSLHAFGTAFRSAPDAHRVDYELRALNGFSTVAFDVAATGDGWKRTLRVTRDHQGVWRLGRDGAEPNELTGGVTSELGDACDVDLELSPLFNSTPVLRDRLHLAEPSTSRTYTMLWVATPGLAVHASRQRYTTLSRADDSTVIRFEDLDGDFVSEVVFDRDGLVADYPHLATRIRTS